MGRVARALAGLFLLVLSPAAITHAADLAPIAPPPPAPAPAVVPPPAEWTVELGLEVRALPHYQGSEVYGVYPFPLLDVRPAGTPPRFHAPRDGIGYALYDTDMIKAGPVLQVELGRHVKHNPALAGLGNVGTAAEIGGFVDYWPVHWLRARAELRQGFGGHHGIVSDETVDVVLPLGPQWVLSGGPRMTLATREANKPYFSIDSNQSAASGLPVYDAGGGVRSVGAGVQARYQWNPRWASHAFVEYTRLVGNVGVSPIVMEPGSPDQVMIGFGTTYSFNVPALW